MWAVGAPLGSPGRRGPRTVTTLQALQARLGLLPTRRAAPQGPVPPCSCASLRPDMLSSHSAQDHASSLSGVTGSASPHRPAAEVVRRHTASVSFPGDSVGG